DYVGNRSARDESRFQTYAGRSCSTEPGCLLDITQNQSLRYIERDIDSIQLHGRNQFPELAFGPFDGLELRWYGAHNTTSQDEPDVRFFANQTRTFDQDGDGAADQSVFQRLTSQGGNVSASQSSRRVFRTIDEASDVFSLSVESSFRGRGGRPGKLKLGAFLDRTDREYLQDSFFYDFQQSQCCDARSPEVAENRGKGNDVEVDDPDALWTDIFTDDDRIGIAPNAGTGPPNRPTVAPNQLLWVLQTLAEDINYDGEQSIDAWFAMAEVPLASHLDLVLGVRREDTRMLVVPVSDRGDGKVPLIQAFCGTGPCENFPPDERPPVSGYGESNVSATRATADIDESFWLPAAGLIWEVAPRMKTRASWSRTIARPTFRELSPVGTEEFLAGDTFVGNPDLVLSEIENYDLRWEWFPGPGDVLAASVFRKEITNPIEFQSFFLGSASVFQPLNFETGELNGFEVEARTGLDVIWDGLRGLAVGANYTSLDSSVDVPEDVQELLAPFELDQETRRLQGQPEFLFNANVTFENPASETAFGVFYNRTGDTLLAGASKGESGVPNVFEIGRATLDFSISQGMGAGFQLTLKGRNLLEEDRETVYRLPDGREGVRTLQRSGRVIGMTLSWRY
ncbi:MAG TPA: TonB-dependent receptor, partial [Candidatus Polarisedimenticolaceae bacterium]|nr:TonB-dependent receptor [Candidatus Polarisedimenticolaceae bacterium]